MGRSKKFGRAVDGIVIVDKPKGITSNATLQQVKKLFFANKAGHTGSLDPLATGVLPICLGEATKFSQFLLNANKAYTCKIKFGQKTDTADAEGEILSTQDASALNSQQVEDCLPKFLGQSKQVPPMYSALKRDGKPLYTLARQGVEVEREARDINILDIKLLDFELNAEHPIAEVHVHCSKGTYIRSLAEDIGKCLGYDAHIIELRRTLAGPFTLDSAKTVGVLEAERGESRAEVLDCNLIDIGSLLTDMPKIILDSQSAYFFRQGQAVMAPNLYRLGEEGDKVRVFEEDSIFMGLGEIGSEGKLQPKRLVVQSSEKN